MRAGRACTSGCSRPPPGDASTGRGRRAQPRLGNRRRGCRQRRRLDHRPQHVRPRPRALGSSVARLVGRRPAVPYAGLRLTHHLREPLPLDGGTTFTFVTDGAPGLDRQPVVASRPAGSATSSGCRTSIQRALCEPRASHKARLRSNWGSRLAAGRTEERRPVTPSPEARSGEVDETKLGSSPKRILVEALRAHPRLAQRAWWPRPVAL